MHVAASRTDIARSMFLDSCLSHRRQRLSLDVHSNSTNITYPYDILRFYDGESTVSCWTPGCQSNGIIRLNRAGTTLPGESPPYTLAAGQWYYMEVKVTIDDSAGAYEVRINGTTVASASGIDTRNSGTGLIDRVQFRGWTGGYGLDLHQLR